MPFFRHKVFDGFPEYFGHLGTMFLKHVLHVGLSIWNKRTSKQNARGKYSFQDISVAVGMWFYYWTRDESQYACNVPQIEPKLF